MAMAETHIQTIEINHTVNNTKINPNVAENYNSNETIVEGINDNIVLNSTMIDSTNPPEKYIANNTIVDDTNGNLLINSSIVDFTNATTVSLINGSTNGATMKGNVTKSTIETVLHALLLIPPVSILLLYNFFYIAVEFYSKYFIEGNNRQDKKLACLLINLFESVRSLTT